MERRVRFRRGVLQVAIVVLLTLLVLEVLLRIVGVTSLILYEADPACGYRIQPRQTVQLRGNTIAINQWGVRDPRPLTSPPSSGGRILVLGDSVTWGGVYVKQEELFTSVLESKLIGTEVVNAGVNGYSVAQMAAMYEAHLTGLEPDTVILFAIPRDFTRPPLVTLTRNSAAFPTERPVLALPVAAGLLRHFAFDQLKWDWLRPGPATIPANPGLSEADCLRENVNAVRHLQDVLKSKADLVVVLFPTAKEPEGSPALNSVKDALSGAGITYVNLGESVSIPPALFLDGVHLTAEGHRAVGEALVSVVKVSEKTQ
ncbi:MAG: SGNH/GDSL hydrolase family protein [Candidatus Hydrogenedentes bacterium]|nr:SGNH/GDSL hydrolase family protein [Candidatus Hydrogenedentota bacterium]